MTGVGGINLTTSAPSTALVDTYVQENANGDPLVSPDDIYDLGSGGMTGGYCGILPDPSFCNQQEQFHADPISAKRMPA